MRTPMTRWLTAVAICGALGMTTLVLALGTNRGPASHPAKTAVTGEPLSADDLSEDTGTGTGGQGAGAFGPPPPRPKPGSGGGPS
jgi:hypothetical protein